MKIIKQIVMEDEAIMCEADMTDKDFDFFWDLLEAEEIVKLKVIINDDLTTAAFVKHILRSMMASYEAGRKSNGKE